MFASHAEGRGFDLQPRQKVIRFFSPVTFVVCSNTAFPSTFLTSMLFPQVRLKQYAGLHVDTLVVPVVCIRVLFAIKRSSFSLLISR